MDYYASDYITLNVSITRMIEHKRTGFKEISTSN